MNLANTRYRRSPFLVATWQDDELTLLNCDTLRRFVIDTRLLELLGRLGNWITYDETVRNGCRVSIDDLDRLVDMGMLERADPDAVAAASLTYWNPFELNVQRRGRTGGFRESAVRARGDVPPSAFKSRCAGKATPLPTPDSLPAGLSDILARRRTARAYDDRPLRLQELSTVLYHSARVVSVFVDGFLGEHALRPFAAGGARSELEIYAVVNDVQGLAKGGHYYDPRAHDLIQVCEDGEHQERLNRRLHAATGGMLSCDPPVVLIITAVFARVMWKYEGIGLALIYKNVGCLTQNLYLVATALDLAPCAVGAGDEATNARWLGLDPLVESQVGCVLLGPAQ